MNLPTKNILHDVRRALKEDIGSGDVTALLLPNNQKIKANIISREPMLFCGKAWVDCIASEMNPPLKITWFVEEGEWLASPGTLCEIEGDSRTLLTAERTLLNFLQTLSGTATQTHYYTEKLKPYHTRLLDTRKTIPGLRLAQKYAVLCAGGSNHRFGLYDAFLIKENHIKACGSIQKAVLAAKKLDTQLLIEVEVETLEEFNEALQVSPDRIMLDNFSIEMIKQAVAINNPKKSELEASGGITLDTIVKIAETGVDYISIGAITKSVKAVDLSLLVID